MIGSTVYKLQNVAIHKARAELEALGVPNPWAGLDQIREMTAEINLAVRSISSLNIEVQDGTANDSVSNTTGATTQVSVSDTAGTTFAYNNGSGGFTFKPTTSDVSASASLQTGELKTFASVGFGTNVAGSAVMPVNQNHGVARSVATFGDSFRTFNGNNPFPWNTTSTSFTLDVTGSSSIPAGLSVGPNQSHNLVQTFLSINIFQAGGLDIFNQIQNCTSCTFSELQGLSIQLQGMIIMSDFWVFGDVVTDFGGFTIPPEKIFPVSLGTPTEVEVNFTPGGDFDWVMTLDSTLFLDASLQNATLTHNFSNTIDVNYTPPAGGTTFSASGLFPETQSLIDAPAQVPEPAAVLLLGLGFIGMNLIRRWTNK